MADDTQGAQVWDEAVLYHCGRRMRIYSTLPAERDGDGKWWRHRYWKCRCGFRDQTRDEVPEPRVTGAVAVERPAARAEGRIAALRRFKR